MSFFDKFRRRKRDAPKSGIMIGGVTSSAFDRFISDCGYTPFRDCPEVRACIHAYADTISSMTIHLMRNAENGDERVKDDPLARKLDINPCRGMTRKQWLYNIVYTMMLTGNGNQITVAVDDGKNGIGDLIPIPASAVSFINRGGGDYDIVVGGRVIPHDECMHFVWLPDPDQPWIGKGMEASAKRIVECLAQSAATKQALLESPTPSIVVKVDGLSERFESEEGRAELGKQFLSARENGRPWFIPAENFAVEQVKPLTIADLAIKDNIELDKRAVASLYQVPPFMLGVGEYNREAHNSFVTGPVMSVAQMIQQRMTLDLVSDPKMYIRLNPRSLMDYSLSELADVGIKMMEHSAMRANEVRDWLGLPPDPEMNTLLSLENYVPVAKLGDQKKLVQGEGGE